MGSPTSGKRLMLLCVSEFGGNNLHEVHAAQLTTEADNVPVVVVVGISILHSPSSVSSTMFAVDTID